MRRGIFILTLGLVVAALGYCCVYLTGTAASRALKRSAQPELAWLQHEFGLSATEFQRISRLHASHLAQCMERCRRIDELNGTLSNALAAASEVTPEINRLLSERAQMRATCQSEMLKHFFEVSRTMPAEQGKRYLAWVQANTCLREQMMDHGTGSHPAMTPSFRDP